MARPCDFVFLPGRSCCRIASVKLCTPYLPHHWVQPTRVGTFGQPSSPAFWAAGAAGGHLIPALSGDLWSALGGCVLSTHLHLSPFPPLLLPLTCPTSDVSTRRSLRCVCVVRGGPFIELHLLANCCTFQGRDQGDLSPARPLTSFPRPLQRQLFMLSLR